MPKKLRFKHDGTRLEKERKKGRKKGEGKRDGGALRVSDHVLPTIQLTRDTLGLLESLGETLSRAKPPTDIPFASPSPPPITLPRTQSRSEMPPFLFVYIVQEYYEYSYCGFAWTTRAFRAFALSIEPANARCTRSRFQPPPSPFRHFRV